METDMGKKQGEIKKELLELRKEMAEKTKLPQK